jgi:subtilisin family serine protease
MECENAVYNNGYYDLIVADFSYLPSLGEGIYTLDGGDDFAILFVPSGEYPPMIPGNYNYNAIPGCYAPQSLEAIEAAGVLQVLERPALELDGSGVLLGFLDTGIDVSHPAFSDEAGRSRIVAIWDQNCGQKLQEQEIVPVPYGTLYYGNTLQLYRNRDEIGHGTYVAGVACGSDRGDFCGAAPGASIAMVHLKPAKSYLKEYYQIPEERLCFQENDIMMGIRFLDQLAKARQQPLVICMSLGNALGSHSGHRPLDRYLDALAVRYGRCVVCGTGNQGAARSHFYGSVSEDPREVELVVEEGTRGFWLEQWTEGRGDLRISLLSPGGTMTPALPLSLLNGRSFSFPLEQSRVEVDASRPELTSGYQLIQYRFLTPSAGTWRIRLEAVEDAVDFHMYLQQASLQDGKVYFLTSMPGVTITDPGNAARVLTVAGYDQKKTALFAESGRGYTIDGRIKPDLAAPAVEVPGPAAGLGERAGLPSELFLAGGYESRSGSSGATAIAAGASALYIQWCLRQQDYRVNTVQVKNFLLQQAGRPRQESYPNPLWGYGLLDLYQAFRRL